MDTTSKFSLLSFFLSFIFCHTTPLYSFLFILNPILPFYPTFFLSALCPISSSNFLNIPPLLPFFSILLYSDSSFFLPFFLFYLPSSRLSSFLRCVHFFLLCFFPKFLFAVPFPSMPRSFFSSFLYCFLYLFYNKCPPFYIMNRYTLLFCNVIN